MWVLSAFVAGAEPLEQIQRYEVQVSGYDRWDVLPLGADGLVLVGQDERGAAFGVRKLDASFHDVWSGEYTPEKRDRLVDTAANAREVWLAFLRPGATEFTVVGFDRATGARTVIPCAAPKRLVEIEGLTVDDAGHAWVLAVFDARRRGDLLAIDLDAKRVTPLDVAGQIGVDKGWFQALTTGPDRDDRSVTVLSTDARENTLWLVPFGTEGVGRALTLQGGANNLLTATRLPAPDGQRGLVIGTYASGGTDRMAQGMFLGGYEGDRGTWTKTHSFTTFDHFFDYLSEKRQERIRRAMERKAEGGGELELNYQLLLHGPLVLDDRVVVVAEAYYPQYHTYTTTQTSTVNGVTTTKTTTYVIFDGWRYTHATVAAFDLDGDRLWDASLPIGDVLLPQIRPVADVVPAADHLTVMYATGGKVYSVRADAAGVAGERGEQAIEAPEEDEVVKRGWGSYSQWWHDDVFLVWGFERVKGDEGRRTVFSFSAMRAP